MITKDINSAEDAGLVKVGSEVWTAISDTDIPLKKGTEVEVEKIEGVKVIVKSV